MSVLLPSATKMMRHQALNETVLLFHYQAAKSYMIPGHKSSGPGGGGAGGQWAMWWAMLTVSMQILFF